MRDSMYYKINADLSSMIKKIDEEEDRRIDTERDTIDTMCSMRNVIHMIDRCTTKYDAR